MPEIIKLTKSRQSKNQFESQPISDNLILKITFQGNCKDDNSMALGSRFDAYGKKKYEMMTMDITKVEPNTMSDMRDDGNGVDHHLQTQQLCAGCEKSMQDRYLLKALDVLWHEDCLKCGCCDCRLGEVGSTLYTKGNLILCRRDYLRLFGNTGDCAACAKKIPAFEMVMRAKNNVYHLDCFACQQCNHRFCIGDRFYLCENKILCEYDYEERLVFASMTNHPMLKRHSNSIGQPQHISSPESNGLITSGNHQQRSDNRVTDFTNRNTLPPPTNKTTLYNESN